MNYTKLLVPLLAMAAPFLAAASEAPKCPPPDSAIRMVSGSYSSQPGVTFSLRDVVGHLIPRGEHPPLCFVKFTRLERGEIFIGKESLTNAFTQKLQDEGSEIRDVKVETGDGTAKISGKIKKVVPIDFVIEGPVSTDGKGIILQVKKITADGIPIKALLEMLGKHLNTLLGNGGMDGVIARDNTLIFQPEQLGELLGHIESAVATPDGLTLRYRPAHGRRLAGK